MSARTGSPNLKKRLRKSKKECFGRTTSSRRPSSASSARYARDCRGVSERLQALKQLIPAADVEVDRPDQLFKETADYILFLRRQVQVLQRLVDFYSPKEEKECML